MDRPGLGHGPFDEKAEGADGFVGHHAAAGGKGRGHELLRLQQQLQQFREVGLHEGAVLLIIPVLSVQKNTEGNEFLPS